MPIGNMFARVSDVQRLLRKAENGEADPEVALIEFTNLLLKLHTSPSTSDKEIMAQVVYMAKQAKELQQRENCLTAARKNELIEAIESILPHESPQARVDDFRIKPTEDLDRFVQRDSELEERVVRNLDAFVERIYNEQKPTKQFTETLEAVQSDIEDTL